MTRLRPPRYSAIWVATALMFAISPLLASNSLHSSALLSMLPFASMLAIAAIGQTLVIQQRGLDLTVPGMILLSTVILTQHAGGANGGLPVALLLVVLACVASGLVSGLAITQFGITPLVATLGVNALLLGTVYQLTGGQATASSPPGLATFAAQKTLGIPNTALIAVIAVVVIATLIRATVPGRRFVAVGASPAAARAAGIRVNRYVVTTYVLASLTYGAAGILITGYLITPYLSAFVLCSLFAALAGIMLAGQNGIGDGDPTVSVNFTLTSITAVVLGGASIFGGRGSFVGALLGAALLTEVVAAVPFLQASLAWQYWFPGILVLVGAGILSRARGSRVAQLGTGEA